MSAVKNLRAMFENKGDDTNLPDRGRSPGPSGSTTPGASFSGSPRPLSKVRTSFVAIEKDGRMGLFRAPSDDGSLPRRKMSNDTDAESASVMSDTRSTTTTGEDSAKQVRRPFMHDPIPESPRLPKDTTDSTSGAVGAVTDEPSVKLDKQTAQEQSTGTMLPADPAIATAPAGITEAKPKNGLASSGSTTGPKATGSAVNKKTSTRPSTIATKTTTKTASSQGSVKTPTSATSSHATKAPVKAATRTVPKKDTSAVPTKTSAASATRTAATSATRGTVSSTVKKPPPIKASTSGTGFVKPKVKSPTKPVSLPASLMAPTASSGAKGARQSLAVQPGNAQAARAPSRNSAATSTGSKFPKATPSSHSRPSVGPPPKKTTPEKPPSAGRDSHVDESFLARMMRPTTASASKTADKPAATPPRRVAGRPSTAGSSSRRASSVRSSNRAKTPSARTSDVAEAPKSTPPAIDEVARETANAETVVDVASAAHEADLAPPPEELPSPAPAIRVEPATLAVPENVTTLDDASPIDSETADDNGDELATDEPEQKVNEVAQNEVTEEQEPATSEASSSHEPAEPTKAEVEAPQEVAEPVEDEVVPENVQGTAEISTLTDDLPETGEVEDTTEDTAVDDEVALETANVETAEEAAELAQEAHLVEAAAPAEDVADIADDFAALKIGDASKQAAIVTETAGDEDDTLSSSVENENVQVKVDAPETISEPEPVKKKDELSAHEEDPVNQTLANSDQEAAETARAEKADVDVMAETR